MAKKIIVGNWKMHPDNPKDANAILLQIKKKTSRFNKVDVVVCPPFPFLAMLSVSNKSKIFIGAQNLSSESEGPFTGEVDSKMLSSIGVSHVIIGHSERRSLGETDDIVAKKTNQALLAKLIPIVCVGESIRDEEGDFFSDLRKMIENSLKGVSKEKAKKIILAYEPVWAIGEKAKGVISPESLHETVIFIRRTLIEIFGKIGSSIQILYGGSVNENNAKDFIFKGHVDGLLVGRESLNPESFSKIVSISF